MGNDKGDVLKTYKLDISAQFYPIVSTKKAQSLYRFTIILDDAIEPVTLETAVNDVMGRFPTFKVRLKRGYAWYYLEENPERVGVSKASGKLLEPIDPDENSGYLFRIFYEKNRIHLEMFHAICDGLSALEFLKVVVFRYRKLQGKPYPAQNMIDPDSAPSDGEIEDSFRRYYRPIKFNQINLKDFTGVAPLLLGGEPSGNYHSEYEAVKFTEVEKVAHEKGVSFTALTAGALAYAIEKTTGGKRPIIMMVPVNLRKMFPSDSLRNFVNFVRLVFKPGKGLGLDDYIREASGQLKKKATPEEMSKFISTTVRTERSLILKIAPVWFKIAAARVVRFFLKSRQTIIFSNVGRVAFPPEAKVERIIFNLNVSKNATVNVGTVTVGDEVTFTFTRSIKDNRLQRQFFETLASLGIKPMGLECPNKDFM